MLVLSVSKRCDHFCPQKLLTYSLTLLLCIRDHYKNRVGLLNHLRWSYFILESQENNNKIITTREVKPESVWLVKENGNYGLIGPHNVLHIFSLLLIYLRVFHQLKILKTNVNRTKQGIEGGSEKLVRANTRIMYRWLSWKKFSIKIFKEK